MAKNPEIKTLETLFIYATNKKAIETILKELELVKKSEGFEEVSLWKNERIEDEKLLLLIPAYKKRKERLIDQDYPVKFRMSKENLDLLKIYFDLMPVERFLLEYETNIETYNSLKKMVTESEKFIYIDNNRNYKDIKMLIKSLISHLEVKTKEFEKLIPVNDKIVHFKKIKVRNDYKEEFLKIVKEVKEAREFTEEEKLAKLQELMNEGYNFEKATKEIQSQSSLKQEIDDVKIRKLLQHYYIPIVYAKEKKDWIKHIINIKSEYDFIENLIEIIDKLDKHYDWWMFSKLDEHLDKDIYIPYISQGKNKKFIPDFIFWLKKKNEYTILFIDPKGFTFSYYLEKLDGYRSIFMEENQEKTFKINDLNIKVKLRFYTTDNISKIPGEDNKKFWIDKSTLLENGFGVKKD